MRWSVWAVAGEALNFAGRKMETILRLIWLPLLMLLGVQLVWAYFIIDWVIEGPVKWQQVLFYTLSQQQYKSVPALAWQSVPWNMMALTVIVVISSLLIIASFMVPLIRFAAKGEKPPKGMFRQSWGMANLRFSRAALLSGFVSIVVLFAPLMAAMDSLHQHSLRRVVEMKVGNHVKFPFKESLHTVYETSIADVVSAKAKVWVLGMPISILSLSIALLLVFLGLMVRHFWWRPRRDDAVKGGQHGQQTLPRKILSLGATLLFSLFFVAVLYGMLASVLPRPPVVDSVLPKFGGPLRQFAVFAALVFSILAYLNLRLFAWPGYAVMGRPGPIGEPGELQNNQSGWFFILLPTAVFFLVFFLCDYIPGTGLVSNGWQWVAALYNKIMSNHSGFVFGALIIAIIFALIFSKGLRSTLAASRGMNLWSIIGLFILVFLITFAMQFVINFLLTDIVFRVISSAYALLVTSSRLLNSGVSAEWIGPTVLWIWTGIKVLVNIFWMIFSYGVLAGLYGRLFTQIEARRSYLP